jgi:predicted ATPase
MLNNLINLTATMKKLIYISAATLTFVVQGVAFANTPVPALDDVDFKQIVCSSLEESTNKEEALTEVLSMIQSTISPAQKQVMVKLAAGEMNSNSYCNNVNL